MANKKRVLPIIVAAIIIIGILGAGIYIYNLKDDEDDKELVEPEREIDDRISPLTTQAVSLEVNRIRKIGIEDQMRKIGNSWKDKPNYFFEAVLDNGLWTSRNINKWDTDYVGWEAFRNVEEELEECTIDFTIYETQKKLLGTNTVEKGSFSIIYDFRTGRWIGDDYFNDSDGYGYVKTKDNGFEIWFDVHQADWDGDGIPYWTEVNVLDTDPEFDDSKLDPDNDNITTDWEWKWGYDPFTWDNHSGIDPELDGLSNEDEYDLRMYCAHPFKQDIYIETDFMEKEPGLFGYEHVFWEESQQMLMDKFTEHGIAVHIDDGIMGGGGEYFPFYEKYIAQESGLASEYYKYHFADARKGVFRYCIIVHNAGWAHPQDYKLAYDVMGIPSNKNFYKNVYNPNAWSPRLQRIAMSVAVMHELGHTLSLRWERNNGIDNGTQIGRGLDDVPFIPKIQLMQGAIKTWENYMSCMNYNKFGQYVLDYSDGTNGENDTDDWSELDLTYFKRHEPEGVEGIEEDAP